MRAASLTPRGRFLCFPRWGAAALFLLGALLSAADFAEGQQVAGIDCALVSYRMLESQELALGQRVTHVGRPVVTCPDGTRIRSDTATVYSVTNLAVFDGNVRYEASLWSLDADHATYIEPQGRLTAIGNVTLVNHQDGSVVRGDTLIRVEGEAPEPDLLTVSGGRPTATLLPSRAPEEEPEVEGEPAVPTDPEPYEVEGNRLIFEGEESFRASGSVQVRREGMTASGDTMVYDRAARLLMLRRDARVEGEAYELAARTIELVLPGDRLEHVRALGEGVLTTADLTLTAPAEIRILLAEERMERLIALRYPPVEEEEEELPPPEEEEEQEEEPPQPEAITTDFVLRGDSLDAAAPGEVLESVTAVGGARGESRGRVLPGEVEEEYPELARNDWIEGDQIIATFEPVSVPVAEEGLEEPTFVDSDEGTEGSSHRIRSLVATGNARSLYRIEVEEEEEEEPEGVEEVQDAEEEMEEADEPPFGPPERRWAISYLLADEIRIIMAEGEVDRMEAEGEVRGIHLEPRRRSTASEERLPPEGAFPEREGEDGGSR